MNLNIKLNNSESRGTGIPTLSNAIKEQSAMIFINNKYTKWYYSIINNARNRVLTDYTEKHHIIPKSLGGNNTKDNLVTLSSREHYVCHLLLTKMVNGENKRKMTFALHSMLRSSKIQKRYKLNSRQYEIVRIHFSNVMSEYMIEISKNRDYKGEKNPFFGKKHSDNTKEKTSGQNHYTKRKDYDPTTHPSKQPGWKEANSMSKKGRKQPIYNCQHCKMNVGAKGNFVRWHGVNCKLNKQKESS